MHQKLSVAHIKLSGSDVHVHKVMLIDKVIDMISILFSFVFGCPLFKQITSLVA